jgi:hypothetical protein
MRGAALHVVVLAAAAVEAAVEAAVVWVGRQ